MGSRMSLLGGWAMRRLSGSRKKKAGAGTGVWEAQFRVHVWSPESVPSIQQDSAIKTPNLGLV